MQRARLSPGGQAGLERGQQAVLELTARGLEGGHHGVDHLGPGEHVAGRHDAVADHVVVHAERAGAGVGRRPAAHVEDGQLAVLDQRLVRDQVVEGAARVGAGLQGVEEPRTQPRVGDVLRGRPADAGAQVHAARGDRGARRRDRHTDGTAAVGGQHGEGHREPSSGITAMASISTSHSGRASAETTRPVEIGCTPLVQRPIVR